MLMMIYSHGDDDYSGHIVCGVVGNDGIIDDISYHH